MDGSLSQPSLSASERRHLAKRSNEGVKLTATFFNATAILILATALVTPLVKHPADVLTNNGWAFLLAALLLDLIGQTAIRLFLQAEEAECLRPTRSSFGNRRGNVGARPPRLRLNASLDEPFVITSEAK